jgi:signal transduction histidine kinase
MVVGVTLPEIVDIRGLTVSVVVVSVCVVAVTSAYVGVLALLDMAGFAQLSTGALGVLAALLSIGFHPLQVLLRGTVDEALFGGRRDPLDAASRVADRLGDDPGQALRAIREALVLPYAALRSTDGHDLAVSGSADTHTRRFVLEGADAELVVGLRPGDLRLTPGDEQVLRLAAPLLAQALRARALAADLQASREATITAVEEERRRLRRDLHDGLGPRLSGIAFTSDAARNLVRTDPEAADALLKQLRADTTTAIEDIRRIVYAMRPPALDELGLVPALRQQASGLRTRGSRPLAVRLDVPSQLPPLPAAVEVAAYRIVTEGLTNVARHSSGSSATVTVRPEGGQLVVEVADDGGEGGPWHAGVGTSSMRERAAELGGSLTAGPTPDGGRVRAVLPITRAPDGSMTSRDQATP